MKAVDTNVLVFAEIENSPQQAEALSLLASLAEGFEPWASPWPCVYEFLRVVTHSRVYHPPVPLPIALGDIERIMNSPSLLLLHEGDRHSEIMMRVVKASRATGNLIHDAHIAALCIEHGVSELLTGDQDFSRFSGLTIRDPFAP